MDLHHLAALMKLVGEIITPPGVLIAGFAALVGAGKALAEFRLQGVERRADRFFEITDRLYGDNDKVVNALHLLLEGNSELKDVPWQTRNELLYLYETVALMVNSGLVPRTVVHYMIGVQVNLCYKSDYFWHEMPGGRDSEYWSLFSTFASELKEMDDSVKPLWPTVKFQRAKFRF